MLKILFSFLNFFLFIFSTIFMLISLFFYFSAKIFLKLSFLVRFKKQTFTIDLTQLVISDKPKKKRHVNRKV